MNVPKHGHMTIGPTTRDSLLQQHDRQCNTSGYTLTNAPTCVLC